MRLLSVLFILSAFSCTNKIQAIQKKPIDVQGNWVLEKEVYEKDIIDYSDNPLKHVLTFGDKGNFIQYSNLARFGLGENLDNILTHGTGDFTIEENQLKLNFSEDHFEEFYEIQSISKEALVLINQDTYKELHYSKKDDRDKS